jgi:hypothetical protein
VLKPSSLIVISYNEFIFITFQLSYVKSNDVFAFTVCVNILTFLFTWLTKRLNNTLILFKSTIGSYEGSRIHCANHCYDNICLIGDVELKVAVSAICELVS